MLSYIFWSIPFTSCLEYETPALNVRLQASLIVSCAHAIMDDNTHDAATDEARRKFFENMKRPAWAAADAAPPDAEKRSDEF